MLYLFIYAKIKEIIYLFTCMEKQEIISQVETSISTKEIKADTNKLIVDAEKILQNFKNKFWEQSTQYKNAFQAYKKLELNIINSIKNDKDITKIELEMIQLEYTNLLRINNWNKNDNKIIQGLDWLWKQARKVNLDTSSVAFLWDNIKNTNQYQEDLIKKILWKDYEKWYNNTLIRGYNNEKWNYIKPLSEVENRLKTNTFQTIWNLEIRNYLNYLDGNNKLTKEYLTRTFWDKKSKEILDFVQRNKEKEEFQWMSYLNTIISVFTQLSETVVQTMEKVKKSVQDFFNALLESKTPQELEENLKNTSQYSPEEKKDIISKLEKELQSQKSQLRLMIFNSLPKSLTKEKKEKLIEELINNINSNLTPKKLWNVLSIIQKFNETNHANLDIESTTQKSLKVQKTANTLNSTKTSFEMDDYTKQLEQAKKSWNKNLIDELTKKWQELTKAKKQNDLNTSSIFATQKVLSQMTTPQIQAVANGTLNYSTVLSDIRKKDTDLDNEIKNIEKSQKEFDKKYPEVKKEQTESENISKSEDSNTKPTQFSYPDGTNINFTQKTSWEYSVETIEWGKIVKIEVNAEELNIIKNNKEALSNMIHFRETLQELNLEGLFKYRDAIFKSISNKDTLAFKTKDDYLNKNELMIFLKAILQSVWNTTKISNNIEDLKSEVMIINKVWLISWQKDVNIYGDSFIENQFIQNFDSKRTSTLDQDKFERSLDNLS